jgi:hypothetical protein
MIYAVMPKEAIVDAMGRRHYRLIALREVTLEITASHEIPAALSQAPRLIFGHGQSYLLLNYVHMLERYSMPSLEKLTPQNPASTVTSEVAITLGCLKMPAREHF